MDKIVECVPNFSEGRDKKVIDEIIGAIKGVPGVFLLDFDPGEATNRTVVTFVGEPEAVKEAAFQGIKKASELIDMRKHHGEHPRMGATDVCPFIPVKGVSMDECVELSREVGERVGKELGIPVYLYEYSATKESRRNLAEIRSGEYEALPEKLKDPEWAPDFGPSGWDENIARTGATVMGARDFLIAYNINLNTTDRKLANRVARVMRESGYRKKTEDGSRVQIPGKLRFVKAIGWYIDEYDLAQISINLTNYHETPLWKVFETAEEEAAAIGLRVTGSEIVGLIPLEAILDVGRHFLEKMGKSDAIPEKDIVHEAILSLGLNEVSEFDPHEKIIEYKIEAMKEKKRLVDMGIRDFADELSRDSAAPGGGSVAAINGALSAALSAMVSNLTYGKKKYAGNWDAVLEAGRKAQALKDEYVRLVDLDTDAFYGMMQAMKLPKKTEEEIEIRNRAIQEATKKAIEVPMRVLELSSELMELAEILAEKGNPNALSDAGVSAITAYAAAHSAYLNVLINMGSIDDGEYRRETGEKADSILANIERRRDALLDEVTGEL